MTISKIIVWLIIGALAGTLAGRREPGGYPSDHFPVTATLRGRAPTAPQPQATKRE